MRPDTAERIYEIYLSKGVHATTSIEGNTLTEEQVRQQIHKKLRLPKSRRYQAQEVQNILDACGEIGRQVLNNGPVPELTPGRIAHFNQLVLRGLEVEEGVVPGSFRKHSVGVMGYRAAPWEDCEYLITQLCQWLNEAFHSADPEMEFAFVLLKAILAHLYIEWIHPFGDGNGRTGRLVEFQTLVQSGLVPLPAGHLLSNHYNKTRSHYYLELDKSSKSVAGLMGFLHYAIQGFVDGLREQIDLVRHQHLEVTWINYVHERFGDAETPARVRQKHLVLDMPPDRATPKKDLPHVSVRVAEDYAIKGEKTLSRDLNMLLNMRLVVRRGKGFVPNRDMILAFLPPGHPGQEVGADSNLPLE